MKTRRQMKPFSLAQWFEPPDGFSGVFGWMCGFTADAAFLDDAIERFTRQTAPIRAANGTMRVALMLDPSAAWLSPVAVAGLAHLRCRHKEELPFRLLHAKVALLLFQRDEAPTEVIAALSDL